MLTTPSEDPEPQSSPTEIMTEIMTDRIEPLNSSSSHSSSVDSKYQTYRPAQLSMDDPNELVSSAPPHAQSLQTQYYPYSPTQPQYVSYYGPGMPPAHQYYYSQAPPVGAPSAAADSSSYSPTAAGTSPAGFWNAPSGSQIATSAASSTSSYSPSYSPRYAAAPDMVYPYPYYPPVYYPAPTQCYAGDPSGISPAHRYGLSSRGLYGSGASYDPESKSQAKIRRRKDPAAPKNPKSAYLYFLTEQRALISQDEDNRDFTDFAKELGAKWRNLSEEDKAPYFEQAKKDKERYLAEKAQYGNRKVFVPTAE